MWDDCGCFVWDRRRTGSDFVIFAITLEEINTIVGRYGDYLMELG
jgi:hypothetical protein